MGEVKLGELGDWMCRRNTNPVAMAQAVGRCKSRIHKSCVVYKMHFQQKNHFYIFYIFVP